MAKTSKAPTKSEVFGNISKKTGLSRKQVSGVLEGLTEQVFKAVSKKGTGLFKIPGLCKVKVTNKPAVPAGERKNPFTGEMKMMPAKPASRKVKIVALKQLKDAAN